MMWTLVGNGEDASSGGQRVLCGLEEGPQLVGSWWRGGICSLGDSIHRDRLGLRRSTSTVPTQVLGRRAKAASRQVRTVNRRPNVIDRFSHETTQHGQLRRPGCRGRATGGPPLLLRPADSRFVEMDRLVRCERAS